MPKLLMRLEHGVVRLEEIAIFTILMGLVANLFLQVLFRFVIKLPLDFTEEISRVLLVWLVFIGSARGVYVGQHFMVSLAFDALPMGMRRVVALLVDLVAIGFLVLLMWYSWHTAQAGASQTLPVLGTSVIVQTLAMPIGTGLMAFHSITLLARHWQGHAQKEGMDSAGRATS